MLTYQQRRLIEQEALESVMTNDEGPAWDLRAKRLERRREAEQRLRDVAGYREWRRTG